MTRDELLAKHGESVQVLDHGHVRLIDVMGDDERVEQVARLSYGKGTRTVQDRRNLLRYLMRHRHCYHPSMEVLTADGWKRWDECEESEVFLVPDPTTRTLRAERLTVEVFDADEELVTFQNSRMSFAVTGDHRMWFRSKQHTKDADGFRIYRAGTMPHCGHFDPLLNYKSFERSSVEVNPAAALAGFILGDGSWCRTSRSQVTFHLRKDRKKQYLRNLSAWLDLPLKERPSATYPDAVVFTLSLSDSVMRFLIKGQRASNKQLAIPASELEPAEIFGLWDGLVNSDGSVKADREQIQFSSNSPHLRSLFEVLSAHLGMDAHAAGTKINVTAYPGWRTSLEARVQHWGKVHHAGKVYCATTSTGLLMVRGGPDKFGFVCGNTSPLEQAIITLDIKMPIFVARQLVRHRTQSINELSGRYSEMPEEYYVPAEIYEQSTTNKQGRGEQAHPAMERSFRVNMRRSGEESFALYMRLREEHVARETARIVLPLSTYTQWCTTMSLHNLLHMLELRLDPHAQWECRVYAEAIAKIVEDWCPIIWEAFVDYRLEAVTFSREEVKFIRDRIARDGLDLPSDKKLNEQTSLSTRERAELLIKLGVA